MKGIAMLLLAAVLAATGHSATPRPQLSYFLPKTTISGSIAHRILRCPSDKDPTLAIAYTPAIAAKASRGRMVVIDAGSGFLVDRSTKVGLDGGIIRTFNSSATGQAGTLMISLLKAAATAYTLSAAPLAVPAIFVATAGARRPLHAAARRSRSLPKPTVRAHLLRCSDRIAATIAELEQVQTEMNDLEARLASAGDPALIALLDRRTVQAAALQDSLTITTSTSRALDPKRRDDGTVDDLVAFVPAPSFEQWLVVETRLVFARPGLEDEAVRPSLNVMLDREGVAAGRPIVGRRGYTINVSVDARMDRLLGCAADAEPAPCSPLDRSEATVRGGRDLVYLRPVPAAASLTPVAEDCKVMRCPEGWGREATTGTSTTLPQLSRLQMVPTGSGSIFGKRTVAAEFDPLGEPISLQYDKGGDAQNTATVVDAVNAVAPNVSDSRLTATKRRLDEEKTKADLVAILEAQLDRS